MIPRNILCNHSLRQNDKIKQTKTLVCHKIAQTLEAHRLLSIILTSGLLLATPHSFSATHRGPLPVHYSNSMGCCLHGCSSDEHNISDAQKSPNTHPDRNTDTCMHKRSFILYKEEQDMGFSLSHKHCTISELYVSAKLKTSQIHI